MPEGFLQSHFKKWTGLFLVLFQSLFLNSSVEFDIFSTEFGTKSEVLDFQWCDIKNRLSVKIGDICITLNFNPRSRV